MSPLFIIHGTVKENLTSRILAVHENEEVAKIVYMLLTMDESINKKYLFLALSQSDIIEDGEDLDENLETSLREDLKKYR
ncbi:MAG: hypothetical protein E3J43_00210 [Candidatus Heimdallarchaeota archaeon]|nr:MAG: hypothetical protein E3J43_00210 [Candidatus Heimdallarchaeota archaeon]